MLTDPDGYRVAHEHLEREHDRLLGQVAALLGQRDRLLLELARHRGTDVDTERLRCGIPAPVAPPRTVNAISGYVDPPTMQEDQ